MKKALLILSAAILFSSCATQSHLEYQKNTTKQPHVNYWF